MLVKSFSALAVVAFAAHANASEAMPYKPLMKMSVHQMFGLGRRQDDTSGYQPTQSVCGTGNTCAEACGAGYETCSSSDEMVHCFNPTAQQTCCPDASGNSCDAGYYCTSDTAGETWCCPNSMDVAACAAAYNITGGLVSETPKPATTSVPTSTYVPTTSTYSAVSSYPISSYFPPKNATVTQYRTNTTTTCPGTVSPSASYPAYNVTTTTAPGGGFTPTSAPTPSQIDVSGAHIAGPAGVLALIAVAGVAALL